MTQSVRFHSARNRFNSQVMWVVLLILALAPFAFGSTKPSFWALWSTILATSGAYYFARLALADATLRVPAHAFYSVCVLYVVLGLYMIVQIVPFGSLVPDFPMATQGAIDLTIGTISLTPDDTIMALMRWFSYGVLFLLVLQFSANQQRAQFFLKLLYWSVVLHAIIALLFLLQFGDTILGIPKWKYFGDALGGFINRNSFATFLALGSVVGINLLIAGTGFVNRSRNGKPAGRMARDTVMIAIGLLVLLVTLIATNSRMGVTAALCGVLFSLGLAFFKRVEGDNRSRLLPLVALLLVAVAFSVLAYGGTFMERLGRTGDAEIRQQLYAQVIEMIGQRPLTGYGGDSFEYVFPLFHRPPVSVDLVWSKTHSTYLALWSDYGLIFGTMPMLLVATVFFRLLAAHRRSTLQEPLLRCGIGAIVVGAVHSLVDFSLEIEAVTLVFVSILAVACARQYEIGSTAAKEDAP